MNTQLIINTTRSDEAYVAIEYNGIKKEKKTVSRIQKAQTVLPLISEILSENGLSIGELTDIRVMDTNGSLTGTRVGFAVANALGYILGIPVNGKLVSAQPSYADKWV